MVTAVERLTLDEFLALPETEPPSEFACGRMIAKPMPSYIHARIAALLVIRIGVFLERNPIASVVTDARHANRREARAYLPDVGVILTANLPVTRREFREGPLEVRPDIAIEIVSPGDRPGRIADKLAFYLRTGVPLTWIIDPDERTLLAYRPGEPSVLHQPPEKVGAEPVLPGFELDLGALFAEIDALGG